MWCMWCLRRYGFSIHCFFQNLGYKYYKYYKQTIDTDEFCLYLLVLRVHQTYKNHWPSLAQCMHSIIPFIILDLEQSQTGVTCHGSRRQFLHVSFGALSWSWSNLMISEKRFFALSKIIIVFPRMGLCRLCQMCNYILSRGQAVSVRACTPWPLLASGITPHGFSYYHSVEVSEALIINFWLCPDVTVKV